MAVYVFRSSPGASEGRLFLKERKMYITWPAPERSLLNFNNIDDLKVGLLDCAPMITASMASARAKQIWVAIREMQFGDWVLHPTRKGSLIDVGVVNGRYEFKNEWHIPFKHYLPVDWICASLPIAAFDGEWHDELKKSQSIYRIEDSQADSKLLQICRENTSCQWIADDRVRNKWLYNKSSHQHSSKEIGWLHLIESIRTQISGNNNRHLLRSIIKEIYRIQGATIQRTNADPRLDEFVMHTGSSLLNESQKTLIHRIPLQENFGRDAVMHCLHSMQLKDIEQGLLISWQDRGTGPFALSAFAAQFNIQLMSGDELIVMLSKHYPSISLHLMRYLSEKMLFALRNRIA